MNSRPFFLLLCCAVTFIFGPPPAIAATGPRLTLATNEYNFGRAMSGEAVKYTFSVTNTGDETLMISNVAPGCHCTTAGDWTHVLLPGQSGRIPIQFDSTSFQGSVTKTITVTSNDKESHLRQLTLRGTVWKSIEITPQYAYLNVQPEDTNTFTTVLHIVNQSSNRLSLSDPASDTPAFAVALREIEPQKKFDLIVTAVSPVTNNPHGTITVHTSLPTMPLLHISAIVLVQPPVNITPMQIVLMANVEKWVTNQITISAHSARTLVLSSPHASDERIKVSMKEIRSGRAFLITAAIPPGFILDAGKQAKIIVHSNLNGQPEITIPVLQLPAQPVEVAPRAHVVAPGTGATHSL